MAVNSEPVVAIAGATGLVGREMIAVLEQREFPCSDVRLFASQNSEGEVIEVDGEEITVQTLGPDSFNGVDIALFATSNALSEQYVPLAAEAGAIAIDNSSRFRMAEDVPLIVPEINADALKAGQRIIANPNCTTAQLVMALHVIRGIVPIKRVVASTYQSVSGAGQDAMDELWNQTLSIFNQQEIPQQFFPHQIAFNCIPQIDTFLETGYTKEEAKIVNETRKILGIPDLKITSTAVRVPVFHSHAISVNVELERAIDLDELHKRLSETAGIELFQAHDQYPMQINAAGGDNVHVGRIRRDTSVPFGLDLWIVADNLRKGAALNAVQIAELCLKKFAR